MLTHHRALKCVHSYTGVLQCGIFIHAVGSCCRLVAKAILMCECVRTDKPEGGLQACVPRNCCVKHESSNTDWHIAVARCVEFPTHKLGMWLKQWRLYKFLEGGTVM